MAEKIAALVKAGDLDGATEVVCGINTEPVSADPSVEKKNNSGSMAH